MRTHAAVVAFAIAAAATVALASDHGEDDHDHHHERHRPRAPVGDGGGGEPRGAPAADPEARALYRKECGSCHLDYPPGFLPAGSHRRVMAGLERHFGQNAELEPEVRDRLEAWLVANAAEAGTTRRSGKILASISGEAPLRVTELPYFRRKHREVAGKVAARPSIGSLANCAACHTRAEAWDFEEDRVRIPAR